MNPKLFLYHPERYKFNRPFIPELTSRVKPFFPDGGTVAEAAPDIYRKIEDIVHDNHMSIVRAENHNLLTSENESESINLLSAAISTAWQEHDAAFSYIPFAMQGSNIFHLTPGLVQEFRQTDIGGTPIGAIIGLPYEHFYIHFGPQRDLILREGVCVEGAYLNRWVFGEPDRLGEYFVSILLVGRVMDLQPESILHNDKYWFKKPESNYRLELFPETSYDEIDSLIEKGLKVIEERLAPESAAKEKKIATERMINVVDKASDEYLHETRANIGVFREALKIALNAIFFINTYPEDIVSEVDAEEYKEQLAEKKSRKARRRFKEKAHNTGYTRIKICGKAIERAQATTSQIADEDRWEMPTHWRRGHWRHQRYGEQRAKIRLKWIRPALVRADKGDPVTGHIYEESQSATSETDGNSTENQETHHAES